MNRLYYGDCLTIMRGEMKLASVDLIYLDPPFNSNRAYNAIYKDETGRPLPDQIEAFCDTWELDAERLRVIQQMPVLMREAGIDDEVAEFWRLWMNALRKTNPRLLAYLTYMAQRLLLMRGLLRPTGSIYLHCDPTASHYIKVLMDSIFWHDNFRNEIVWKRYGAHNDSGRYGRVHDTIFFYSKGNKCKWNGVWLPLDEQYVKNSYRNSDEKGRFRTAPLHAGGLSGGGYEYEFRGYNRLWRYPEDRMMELEQNGLIRQGKGGKGVPERKVYLEDSKGRPASDWWGDINSLAGSSKERMGYTTQKPLALLERIITASTDKGDVVFDPFCGCATTLEAAHKLGRKWIGIDIAIHAVKRVAKIRLEDRLRLAEGADFIIEGVPRNLEGAQDLWKRDKYHFQKWAVEEVDGFVTTKRTADGGIDGRIYFAMPNEAVLQSMVLEVKGGANVTIADLRALHSVLEREEALMAGLIIMQPLGTQKMRNFNKLMAEAGDLDVMGILYPRMQILTVPDIFEGRRFDTPGAVGRGDAQKVLHLPSK
ncbi:MAG: site-specific DNA-methyltransferase [Gammaproteobacteria bacterium]|nr:site-specific DNA-methyltransferase [Gammaproteobacteria bacterium]